MADYMLVFVPQTILNLILQLTPLVVECESQQHFNLINSPHKGFWIPCNSYFHLVVFGFSIYCLFV